jgi:hypothetical protein
MKTELSGVGVDCEGWRLIKLVQKCSQCSATGLMTVNLQVAEPQGLLLRVTCVLLHDAASR